MLAWGANAAQPTTISTPAVAAGELVYGYTLTFASTVTPPPGVAPGVTFTADTQNTVPLFTDSSGTATLQLKPGAGAHSITARFGGNADFGAAVSGTLNYTVAKAATRMQMASNAPQLGLPVSIRAAVYLAGGDSGYPSGTVDFAIGGAAIPGCSGLPVLGNVAICETSFPQATTLTVTANYRGDGNTLASAGSLPMSIGRWASYSYIAYAPDQPVYGGPLSVNGLILGADGKTPPTGTITFLEGATTVGTAALGGDGRAGIAPALGAGTHTIVVSYSGDANYQPSVSKSATISVAKAAPVFVVSATPAQLAQPVTITASVSPLSSGGTVAFTPVTGCGAVAVVHGIATCQTSFAAVGDATVRADYSGDVNTLAATATLPIPVSKALPGVYAAFTPKAPAVGDSIELDALVLGAPGVPAPTGAVTFSLGGAPLGPPVALDVATGRAQFRTTMLAGSYSVWATYSGDDHYQSIAPVEMKITVAKATPVVAVSAPPAQVAQPLTITASVTAPQATGTVTFAGIAGCALRPLQNGTATCATSFGQIGEVTVTANYSGDANTLAGSASVKVTVNKVAPSLYFTFAPAAPVAGEPIDLSALVLGAANTANPGGTITFLEGEAALSLAVPIDWSGRAKSRTTLLTGVHTVAAVYSGDLTYQAAAPVEIKINVVKATPVVAISATPVQIDQPVTITASVTAPNPTGTITFTPVAGCAAVPLQQGRASCKTTFPLFGYYPITAAYSGDANTNAGSASMRITVGKAAPGVYVAFTPAAPVSGETVQLSALTLAAAGVGTPTGTVVFSDGAAAIAAQRLGADGRASVSTIFTAGQHPILAEYNGDGNYGPAPAVAVLVVGKANTTTAVTATTGGPFTAVVSPIAPGSGAPTGTVRFLRDGQAIGTAALVPMGAASAATIPVSTQVGNITAEYAGDANCTGSISPPVAVSAPRAQVTLSSSHNPAAAGQAVIWTAAVTPNPGTTTPTGSVQFAADGAALGSATVAAGRATYAAALAAGTHTITASYTGDATYPAAQATLTQTVSAPAATLTLTSSAADIVFGQAVTLTAQLTPGGSGVVQFSDGGAPLGTAGLAAGSAQLTVASLGAGAHAVTASWGAASAQVAVTVGKARTLTGLSLAGGTAVATVAVAAPGAGTPTGSVRFVNALTNVTVAAAPLAGGRAAGPAAMAMEPVVAVYPGDENFLGSASAPVSALAAVNAASYLAESFAPDEIVTLFGGDLAGADSAQVIDSAGTVRAAEVLYAGQEQAAIVMPRDLAPGQARLRAGAMAALVPISATAPGLFTRDSSGKGTAAGEVVRVNADGSQTAGAMDAIELDDGVVYVVLYGTGIRHYGAKPTCRVVGRDVEVVYAGAQGAFPGLDQVNVLLPASLRGSGVATVELTVDGVAANAVTVGIR